MDAAQRKVLMVAYLFPPGGGIGAAGAQRVLKFAKYLPRHGWQPIVLTVRDNFYEGYFQKDTSLLERVPADTVVLRTGMLRFLTPILSLKRALTRGKSGPAQSAWPGGRSRAGLYRRAKDAITDLFEIPDEQMGWLLPGARAGLAAVRRYDVDVVYATGRPWTGLVIGTAIKRLTGKPLVSDFRDPWITNPFRNQSSKLKDALERWLERVVIERSNVVIANTDTLRTEFIGRFPWKLRYRFTCIPNGFDPEDYQQLALPACPPADVFHLTHTGFLYGKRDPKTLLEGLKIALDRRGIPRDGIRLHLVGSVELAYDLGRHLREQALEDVVVLEGHVPYRESLERLSRAHVLLLLQPGTTTQVPSKLFEYVGMKRPILAITPRDGATAKLISEHGLGTVVEAERVDAIADALIQLYRQWRAGAPLATGLDEAWNSYNSENSAAALAQTLAEVDSRARQQVACRRK
jgi:glycosyltransferase involved in cell wall biosynthesis